MDLNPITLEIVLEVVKAIIGVAIPALTIALTLYTKKLNSKLKKKLETKSIKDEIHRLTQLARGTQTFKTMNIGEQRDILLESMRAFVIANEIDISEAELMLMIERAIQSDNNLQMRFNLLDKTRSEE
jgi:hypothetical protein